MTMVDAACCWDGDIILDVDELACAARISDQSLSSWEFTGELLRHKLSSIIAPTLMDTQLYQDEHNNLQLKAISRRALKAGDIVLSEIPVWKVDQAKLRNGAVEQCADVARKIMREQTIHNQTVLKQVNFDGSIFFPALAPKSKKQHYEIYYDQYCPNEEEIPAILHQCLKKGLFMLCELGLIPASDVCYALQYILISITNFFECEINEHGSMINISMEPDVHPVMAMCRATSRLNHSCRPNCWFYFEEGKIVLRALVDIDHGEELTHSYLEAEKWLGLDVRRKLLKCTKFFTCHCSRCVAEEKRNIWLTNELTNANHSLELTNIIKLEHRCSEYNEMLDRVLLSFSSLTSIDIQILISSYEQVSRLVNSIPQSKQYMLSSKHRVLSVMNKFYEAMYEISKFSLDWYAASCYMKAWINCLKFGIITPQVLDNSISIGDNPRNEVVVGISFDRPSNRTAWMVEYYADALSAYLGCPLSLIYREDPELLSHMQQLQLQQPSTTKHVDRSALVREEAKMSYKSAVSELALVYGVSLDDNVLSFDSSIPVATTKSQSFVRKLQVKASAIVEWLYPLNVDRR